jgi:hypothetical protein
MANFAVLKDNVVVNIIVAESIKDAIEATGLNCVLCSEETPVQINWVYDGINFNHPIEE